MRSSLLVTSVLLIVPGLSALACEVPSLPVFPVDERIRGRVERELKQEMVRYITDMSVYVACVHGQYEDAARRDAPQGHLARLATRHNDAIGELEAVRDIYVANVGPIEELFFEQSFGAANRRGAAMPRMARLPTGPDTVLGRTEMILGDDGCPEISICNKEMTSPGQERNRRPLLGPSRADPVP
jgi:hypothetical protein